MLWMWPEGAHQDQLPAQRSGGASEAVTGPPQQQGYRRQPAQSAQQSHYPPQRQPQYQQQQYQQPQYQQPRQQQAPQQGNQVAAVNQPEGNQRRRNRRGRNQNVNNNNNNNRGRVYD